MSQVNQPQKRKRLDLGDDAGEKKIHTNDGNLYIHEACVYMYVKNHICTYWHMLMAETHKTHIQMHMWYLGVGAGA